VLAEPAEAPRLIADDAEAFAIFGFLAAILAEVHVRRGRRAELVRRLGRELPLGLERRPQPGHQRVECAGRPRSSVPVDGTRAAWGAISVIGQKLPEI
jgi:hypothetical protein